MFYNIIFCSYLNTIKWLQNYMIPCPLKKLTGFDCPGCGFQRSLIALLKGDVLNSLYLYPATLPIIVVSAFCIADARYQYDKKLHIKKPLLIFTAAVIAVAYVIKLTTHSQLAYISFLAIKKL